MQVALAKIVSCFISDPDQFDVRSSVVFHDGEDPAEPFGVVNFGFSDDDRHAIYIDGNLTVLVYETDRVPNVPTAESKGLEWVKGGDQVDFRYLPGIYQAAYVEFLTGSRLSRMNPSSPGRFRRPAKCTCFGSSHQRRTRTGARTGTLC